MNKKLLSTIFIILFFILSSVLLIPHNKIYQVQRVVSPTRLLLDNTEINYDDLDCFDSNFTEHNKNLAKTCNITEEEAFVMGNLGKYWASNLMTGRKVTIKDSKDVVYQRHSYRSKFMLSGFCIKNNKPCYKELFEKHIAEIRRADYKVLDTETDIIYDLNDKEIRNLKHFLIIRKSHLPRQAKHNIHRHSLLQYKAGKTFDNIKIFVSDATDNLVPSHDCKDSICKEILTNINNSKNTIDIAIYGYSRVYKIEEALKAAQNRGVKIRLVYDLDPKGNNIYPDTKVLTQILKNNNSDINSPEAKNIMHNKFYIFDDKILITGSANLSHTDMSGFNSNNIIVINSPDVAKIYKNEFEQMYSGKFHNDKISAPNKNIALGKSKLSIYFSPQDKAIANGILPLIKNAKNYIYIPTFLITNVDIVNALIDAKKRGVDVKIIVDALNASVQHSKHKELRESGIQVKTENYAGKMHSKSIIIDDKYTVIGSMNFSYNGENRNDENVIIIENSDLAKFYKSFFLYQWNKIDDKWLKFNARAEGKDSIGSCSDGIDNNYDGFVDLDDPACTIKQ